MKKRPVQLTEKQLQRIVGGLNPQPLPPGAAAEAIVPDLNPQPFPPG
jgi:hypothetical protein